MSNSYQTTFFGNTITAERFHDADAGAWKGRAVISRGGTKVHEITADDNDKAFALAWRWSCMHRPISLRIEADLVEHRLMYSPPGDFGAPIRVYTATSKAEAEEAELVFRELLRRQWGDELAEHERRREALPAKLAMLDAAAAGIEDQIRPLKEQLVELRGERKRAPGEVFAIDTGKGSPCEDTTVADLGETMVRRLAERAPSLQEMAADDPRVACPACGKWADIDKRGAFKPHRPSAGKALLGKSSAGWCNAAGSTRDEVLEKTDGEVVEPAKKTPRRSRK